MFLCLWPLICAKITLASCPELLFSLVTFIVSGSIFVILSILLIFVYAVKQGKGLISFLASDIQFSQQTTLPTVLLWFLCQKLGGYIFRLFLGLFFSLWSVGKYANNCFDYCNLVGHSKSEVWCLLCFLFFRNWFTWGLPMNEGAPVKTPLILIRIVWILYFLCCGHFLFFWSMSTVISLHLFVSS